jgi:hypothetical protein
MARPSFGSGINFLPSNEADKTVAEEADEAGGTDGDGETDGADGASAGDKAGLTARVETTAAGSACAGHPSGEDAWHGRSSVVVEGDEESATLKAEWNVWFRSIRT